MLRPFYSIYALGILALEMLTGKPSWEGLTPLQIATSVTLQRQRLPIPTRCPARLAKIIRSCWEHDPACRPDAAEVVKQLALVRREVGHVV